MTDYKNLIERLRSYETSAEFDTSDWVKAADALQALEKELETNKSQSVSLDVFNTLHSQWMDEQETVCVLTDQLAEAKRMRGDEFDDRLVKCSATLAAERRAHEIELAEERRKNADLTRCVEQPIKYDGQAVIDQLRADLGWLESGVTSAALGYLKPSEPYAGKPIVGIEDVLTLRQKYEDERARADAARAVAIEWRLQKRLWDESDEMIEANIDIEIAAVLSSKAEGKGV